MGKEAPQEALIDTCVLINFLQVDQASLLGRHPRYRVLITNHVRSEIRDHYPEQLERLKAAFDAAYIHESTVETPKELDVFATLVDLRRFGTGECSSIAAATVRAIPLATDDRTARKHIQRAFPALTLFDTQEIIVDLLKAGILDIATADALKDRWAIEFRFRLTIASFSELL